MESYSIVKTIQFNLPLNLDSLSFGSRGLYFVKFLALVKPPKTPNPVNIVSRSCQKTVWRLLNTKVAV